MELHQLWYASGMTGQLKKPRRWKKSPSRKHRDRAHLEKFLENKGGHTKKANLESVTSPEPSTQVQSEFRTVEAVIPNGGPEEAAMPRPVGHAGEGLPEPVLSCLDIGTTGEQPIQSPELCSVVPEPCMNVVHRCQTFDEFLTIFDDSDLERVEEDLQDLCNSTRKEICVITRVEYVAVVGLHRPLGYPWGSFLG
jgi:hypothetical protein